MADKAVNLEATNYLGLPAAFNTASSNVETSYENAQALDAKGNVKCQYSTGGTLRYTQNGVTYCGADFGTGLGGLLSNFGLMGDGTPVDTITINCTAGQFATVDFAFHNHATNAHDVSSDIGFADMTTILAPLFSWDGKNIPDFGVTLGDNTTASSATITLSINHIDSNDENGDHFSAKNTTARCELSMEFEGIPTSATASALETDLGAGWFVDSVSPSDSNSAMDTFSFNAHINADIQFIPQTITVSGAGTSNINDSYAYTSINNSRTLYNSSVADVVYNGTLWTIYSSALGKDVYSAPDNGSILPPKTGWTTLPDGTAPAPTISY